MELTAMKDKGVTLIELISVMVIMGFVILLMACQFVAQTTFSSAISHQVTALNEVSAAMYNMTRVLRYVDSTTINNPSTTSITGQVDAFSPAVTFSLDATNPANPTITYKVGAAAATVIANNVSYFYVHYDPVNHMITLQATVRVPYNNTAAQRSSSLEVSLRILPY